MTLTCDHVQERAADLVRDEVPAEVHAHLDTCASCRQLVSGAEALRGDLDAWTAPAPPANLLDDTMARLALAAGGLTATSTEESPAPVLRVHEGGGGRRARRRTSVEVLTDHLDSLEPGAEPTRKRLLLRLCAQAAAAVVLFGVCTTFVAVFYPAVTFALEDRRVKKCQKQLGRLAKAAALYHSEHPEAAALRGSALRKALISGGYADELDFVCPSHNGSLLGDRSYVGNLPAGGETIDDDQVVYIDQFANHSTGFNVAYGDGRVESMTPERLTSWRETRMSNEDEDEDEE